jgi:MFS transporter, putative metabolite:H+ symporter
MYRFTLRNTYESEGVLQGKQYQRGVTYKYNDVIKEVGFGSYQYKIIATIAMVNVSLGIFAGLLPFLIPLVKLDIQITPWQIGLLISSQSIGSLLGGLAFSYISDLEGRKFSIIWALGITIISSILCTLFTNFYPFLAFRFFAGVGYGGVLPVGVTYLTEYLPDSNRGFWLIIMEIFRNIGGVICIGAASFSNDSWRFFVLAPVGVMFLTMLVIIFALPESSRYLLYVGNTDAVVKLFDRMCKENNRNFTVTFIAQDDEENKLIKERRDISIFNDLIIKKCRITFPLLMIWFFPAFGYGVYVFLPEIMLHVGFEMREIYALSTFLLILPMAGILVTTLFIDAFGRKQLISLSTLIAGLSLMTFLLYPVNSKKIIMFYVILGVFSIFMKVLRSVTYAYTPELYSTSIRTSALGLMSASDRFASILQPMIFSQLVYTSFRGSLACFGACLIIAFFFSLTLTKESSNRPLKESFLTDVSDLDIARSALATSMISDTQ